MPEKFSVDELGKRIKEFRDKTLQLVEGQEQGVVFAALAGILSYLANNSPDSRGPRLSEDLDIYALQVADAMIDRQKETCQKPN